MEKSPIAKKYFLKLIDESDWNIETVKIFDSMVEWINDTTFNLDIYPNQFEVVTTEQMLDAYSLTGLPLSYNHWKFGKDFSINEGAYRRGQMGLSYEMVINCLRHDSRIISERGIKPISDINLNEFIWNGNKFVEVTSIKESKKVGNKIILSNRKEIYTTDNHIFPVYTKSGIIDKKVSELYNGDYLLLNNKLIELKNETNFSNFNYTPPFDKNNKFRYTKYCKIPNHMTEELSELIGIIIGDGSMGHTTTKACDIIIGFPDIENNNNYDKYVSGLIKKVFDIEPSIKTIESKNGENKILQILSTEIKDFFNYIGLYQNYTHKNKRVPKSIYNSGTKNIKLFLRGLFDTDGSFKNGYIKFSGYNHDLINDIHILLNSIGINSKINIINNRHQKISGISVPSYYRTLFIEEIGSSIKRKKEDLEKDKSKYNNNYNSYNKTPDFLIKKYENHINKRYGYSSIINFIRNIGDNIHKEDKLLLSKYDIIKIKDIEKTNEDIYIDITVDSDDHYFCSEGIITHNCNPCISYNMEENSTCLLLLVMIHAGIGHNTFFKNNYLFKQWTHADSILDYMSFAKRYIRECEEKYGEEEVEKILDACHALMNYGVSKYKKPFNLDLDEEKSRIENINFDNYAFANHHFWAKTLPKKKKKKKKDKDDRSFSPEENILYFLEKNSPILKNWQKEIVRIVRKIAQYFYPQSQCLVGGTYINTNNGFIKMEDIIKEEGYYKSEENLLSIGNKFEKTSHFYKRKTNKTIKIKTKLGKIIEVTPEHPLMVIKQDLSFGMIKSEELKNGDYLVNKIGFSNSFSENNFKIDMIFNQRKKFISCGICKKEYQNLSTHIPTHNLSVSEYKLKFSNNIISENLLYKRSEDVKIPKEMNGDIARLLGYFISEGSWIDHSFTISNQDIDIINDTQKILKSEFNLESSCVGDLTKTVSAYNTKFFEILGYIGVNNVLSYFKEIPKSILQSKKGICREFLSALFEGDGYNTESGQIQYSTRSRILSEQVQMLLQQFGIVSKIYEYEIKYDYKIDIPHKINYKVVILGYFYDKFLNDIGFLSERKNKYTSKNNLSLNTFGVPYLNEKISEIRNSIDKSTSKNKRIRRELLPVSRSTDSFKWDYVDSQLERFEYLKEINIIDYDNIINAINKENYYDEIISIEILNEEKYVFDVTIPSNHLFITNGVVSHNTKIINEGCLVEGSLILTEDGYLDIKYLAENKYSGKVWDGSEWRQVYDWFINKNVDRVKIITKRGYVLNGGSDHKILIGKGWKKLNTFSVGDNINLNTNSSIFPKEYININYTIPFRKTISKICEKYGINFTLYNRYFDEKYEYNRDDEKMKICYLIKEEFDSQKLSLSHNKRNTFRLPSILDEDLSYWLGYLVGDGHCSIKSRQVGFTTGDIEIMEKIVYLTESLFDIIPIVKKDGNRYRISISNLNLLDFIVDQFDIKIGKSSHIKEIPNKILQSPKSVISSFIRGHFDADGCASETNGLILVSNSDILLKREQEILLNFGIISNLKYGDKNKYDKTNRLYITSENAKKFQEEIGFFLDRKNKKLKKYVENRERFNTKNNYSDVVVKIEIDKGITYDFSVEKSHKYSSGPFINHNCATYTHYTLLEELSDRGFLSDKFMLEFYHIHSGVIHQPPRRHFNPYTLGFNIMKDVERIVKNPTSEDKEWFPNLIGQDWNDVFKDIIENYKDDSFIYQFLSPKVMRDMRMFSLYDEQGSSRFLVEKIHNERGYKHIRETLSKGRNRVNMIPEINILSVDWFGDRSMTIKYTDMNDRKLKKNYLEDVVDYIHALWGFQIKLIDDKDELIYEK